MSHNPIRRRDPMEDLAVREAVMAFDWEFTTDDIVASCPFMASGAGRRRMVFRRMSELVKEGFVARIGKGRFRKISDAPMIRDESALARKSPVEIRWDKFKETGALE